MCNHNLSWATTPPGCSMKEPTASFRTKPSQSSTHTAMIYNPRAQRYSPPTQHKWQMGSNTGSLGSSMPFPVSGWETEPFRITVSTTTSRSTSRIKKDQLKGVERSVRRARSDRWTEQQSESAEEVPARKPPPRGGVQGKEVVRAGRTVGAAGHVWRRRNLLLINRLNRQSSSGHPRPWNLPCCFDKIVNPSLPPWVK
jgi:hypothetical protein